MLSFAVSKSKKTLNKVLNKALSPLAPLLIAPKKATPEDEDKLVRLLEAMQDHDITPEGRIGVLHAYADTLGIDLSKEQIRIILKDNEATLNELLQHQPYEIKPNVKLTLQLILALAAMHYPGMAASIITTNVLLKVFERVVGNLHSANMVNAGLWILNLYFSAYSPRGLGNYYVGKCFENYGLVTYAAGPTAWFLYQKSKDTCRYYTDFLGITEPVEPLFPVSDGFFRDEAPSFNPQFKLAKPAAIEKQSKGLITPSLITSNNPSV